MKQKFHDSQKDGCKPSTSVFSSKSFSNHRPTPGREDLFPAKVGDDVDTFQFAIQITFIGREHFEEADIIQICKSSLALVTERW